MFERVAEQHERRALVGAAGEKCLLVRAQRGMVRRHAAAWVVLPGRCHGNVELGNQLAHQRLQLRLDPNGPILNLFVVVRA